jgi:hypothetical protein
MEGAVEVAHVTFIHGIANKPAPEVLLEQWRVALLDDDGLDLDALGVTMSMVYWADVMYAEPALVAAAHESSAADLTEGSSREDEDLAWARALAPSERAFVEALGLAVGLPLPEMESVAAVGLTGQVALQGSSLEAVPLPWWLKRRLMRVLLRDVHHYLFDAASTPRPGETFQVRREIRARAVAALHGGAARPGPHVVVGHSLGSVIAYDVLTGGVGAPDVDALVTLGSPLGLSEVQHALAPPWTVGDGWPATIRAGGSWTNFADRLDPVCGADPRIASDYRRAGETVVTDVLVGNGGSWRHSVTKYLGQLQVRSILRGVLRTCR